MHGRYTEINPKQIKACDKCGAQVFFVQNRFGKRFPVDVVYPGTGEHRHPAYKHSAGAYKNMIPWHRCLPRRDFAGEELVKQAQRCMAKLATAALREYRANPDVDHTRVTAVYERIGARIQRRIALLPDASKPYVRGF
jgi:hypothetical protein